MKLLFFSMISLLFFSCGNSIKQVKEYYDDGSLKLIYETFRGLKHGKYIEYHPNGNIKLKSNWINDTIGLSVRFYESGIIESTTPRLKGQLHGVYVMYDKSGNIYRTISYHHGEKCGYYNFYDEGLIYQSFHLIFLGDSSYFNQAVRFDGYGNIRKDFSSFYSIYTHGNSDTIQINKEN